MTSPCKVHIFSDNESKARRVAGKILENSKKLETKYNFYNPTSYLSAINQRKIEKLDSQTEELLKKADTFAVQTKGIFDVTMGTLVQGRKEKSLAKVEEAMQQLLPYVGTGHFKINRHKIRFDNPHTLIDFGGFVKEYAVDMAVKILKKHKIASALVNFGGDIYALGLKLSDEPFSIGIKNPKNPHEYLTHIEISNQALTTSASYERNHQVEKESFSHIVSRDKLQQEILSATVISSTTLASGVFSTTLMVDPHFETPLKKILINKSLTLC